jgi:two-component system cell cycle sensor histidine kinase/response regulator CckA
LRVSDTGIGMDDAVKERIFEPFFTTKGPDKGTGLGLATVFGIVQRLGGQIHVDTAPGCGTTFTLTLPWAKGQTVQETRTPLPPALVRKHPRQSGRLLLVEDEDSLRKLARLTLENQGYEVLEAPDGEAALHQIEMQPDLTFEVLVTDLVMPGMDGRELAERLLTRYPHLAIVFMSGYVPEEVQLDTFAGAVFLPKPFTPSDLSRAVWTARQRTTGSPPPGEEAVRSPSGPPRMKASDGPLHTQAASAPEKAGLALPPPAS